MTTVTASFTVEASVDTQRRRIVGLIVPFGEVGNARLAGEPAQLRFEAGSLTWEHPEQVKLVVDHTGDRPVFAGKGRDLVETPDGIMGTFSVARTTAGDDLLVEAAEGLRTGLSIEAELPAELEQDDDGVWTVTAANPGRLYRVAGVERPAFASAQVHQVAAAEVPDEQLAEVVDALHAAADSLAANLPTDDGGADQEETMSDTTSTAGEAVVTQEVTAAATPPVAPAHVTAATSVTREAFPYGHAGAEGRSLFRDLVAAKTDPDAARRFRTAEAMLVEAANEPVAKSNVLIPNIYDAQAVMQLTFPRVITDALPKTGVDSPQPILIPTFTSATADGGSGEPVASHSEGTNPAQAELAYTSQTVTPAPYSGIYDINREALDGGDPQADAFIIRALVESYAQVTEAAAVTAITGAGSITTPTSVATNADLEVEARAMAKQIRAEMAAFEARRGVPPSRVLFATDTYSSALSADSTSTSGNPLYPFFNPTNVGASAGVAGFTMNIYGVPGRQAFKLTSAKVLQLCDQDVRVFESPTLTFRWDEVAGPAKIRFALYGYFAAKVVQPKGITLHTQL